MYRRSFTRFQSVMTFYDSQSGKTITIKEGIRLHDISLSKINSISEKSLETKLYLPSSVEFPSQNLNNLNTLIQNNKYSMFAKIDGEKDLETFLKNHKCVSVKGIVLDVKPPETNYQSIVNQIEIAKENDLIVQVKYFTNMFFNDELIQKDVLYISNLADAGCDQIILVPLLKEGSEEEKYILDEEKYILESFSQEMFSVDIAGAPMTQRLGIQTNFELSKVALNNNFTRLVISSNSSKSSKFESLSEEEIKRLVEDVNKNIIIEEYN